MLMIIIDSREDDEKARGIREYLSAKGISMDVRQLPAGDYFIIGREEGRIIERKGSPDDLVSSMNDGRIWEQMRGMASFECEGLKEIKPILVLEGNPVDLGTRYAGSFVSKWDNKRHERRLPRDEGDVKSILARLHSIVDSWDMRIVPTGSWRQTAIYLAWLDSYLGSEREKRVRKWGITVPKELPADKQAVAVLASIVGQKTAIAILEHFGSLRAVFAEKNVEAFENIRVWNRRISKSVIKRLMDVADVKIVEGGLG